MVFMLSKVALVSMSVGLWIECPCANWMQRLLARSARKNTIRVDHINHITQALHPMPGACLIRSKYREGSVFVARALVQ